MAINKDFSIDLIFVTYNSAKWIRDCFASIRKQTYTKNRINVYVVDNASTDDTMEILEEEKTALEKDGIRCELIPAGSNLGFGKANNLGFAKGSSKIAAFLNIDTELEPDTLAELAKDIRADVTKKGNRFALWELRQFPYEHPKMYDPITHETTWCSGAAFAVRRDVYEKMGGFDPHLFMYAEDVDLSWRIRSYGYKLKYVPRAVIHHYSYTSAGEVKPVQYTNSIVNNLLLRYRFGGVVTIARGHMLFWHVLLHQSPFPKSRSLLLKSYLEHFKAMPYFLNKKGKVGKPGFRGNFPGFDYAPIRMGAFYENEFPKEQPLVSIIVRTCGRPDVLRETLQSLRWQTYKNFEVMVVEDGEDTSGDMIRSEFSDMNIRYQATGEKVGRSKAGNIAITNAKGKYINFLDDDDVFYADHIEVLVKTLERNPGKKAAYAFAFATPIVIQSKAPYRYKLKDFQGIHHQGFDKIMLCHHNYIPIECIMFEKSLFEEYGGLDESLDALEDWDLWVRYSMHTDFAWIEKTTSQYRIPYDQTVDAKRQKELDDALKVVREKHKGYSASLSAFDLCRLFEKIGV